MSAIDEHADLFKADWITTPELLAERIRAARVSDRFTAELAAWCAEIHEHLRELADELKIDLLLMGGNGAALRFDAVKQRGSRDNDYLTAASRADIARLMARLGERFAPLGDLIQPRPYEPKRPVRELPLVTYVVAVPLVLDHGYNHHNEIKLEFHFEERLPPSELVTGVLGPAATPEITGALPQLPYQIGFKLMTLAAEPVGIEEDTRAGAVPRQIYDLDGLCSGLADKDWAALCAYARDRYQYECERAGVVVAAAEPFDGVRARLERWGNCLDENAEPWLTIRSAQESGLQRAVHRKPWGWRARAYRLIVATEALRRGPDAWPAWQNANALAALIPSSKAKQFRPPLAELSGIAAGDLPLELHDVVWTALDPGPTEDIDEHLARAEQLLRATS